MTPTEITALAERLEERTRHGFTVDAAREEMAKAATALRALLTEREAIKPFIDLAVAATVEGSPDYREWVGQANDWMVVFSFAGQSITLGQLRALADIARQAPVQEGEANG